MISLHVRGIIHHKISLLRAGSYQKNVGNAEERIPRKMHGWGLDQGTVIKNL